MVIFIITAVFILLDFVTGIVKAFKNKEYNSSVMREGLFHKAGSILVIVFGSFVDYAQDFIDLGISVPVASPICAYICMMEIGSIIENLCLINPSFIPVKLQSYFEKLSTKVKEKDVDNSDEVHGQKR